MLNSLMENTPDALMAAQDNSFTHILRTKNERSHPED